MPARHRAHRRHLWQRRTVSRRWPQCRGAAPWRRRRCPGPGVRTCQTVSCIDSSALPAKLMTVAAVQQSTLSTFGCRLLGTHSTTRRSTSTHTATGGMGMHTGTRGTAMHTATRGMCTLTLMMHARAVTTQATHTAMPTGRSMHMSTVSGRRRPQRPALASAPLSTLGGCRSILRGASQICCAQGYAHRHA
jgi:hypothetical protein